MMDATPDTRTDPLAALIEACELWDDPGMPHVPRRVLRAIRQAREAQAAGARVVYGDVPNDAEARIEGMRRGGQMALDELTAQQADPMRHTHARGYLRGLDDALEAIRAPLYRVREEPTGGFFA
jgi:hypothetical protein